MTAPQLSTAKDKATTTNIDAEFAKLKLRLDKVESVTKHKKQNKDDDNNEQLSDNNNTKPIETVGNYRGRNFDPHYVPKKYRKNGTTSGYNRHRSTGQNTPSMTNTSRRGRERSRSISSEEDDNWTTVTTRHKSRSREPSVSTIRSTSNSSHPKNQSTPPKDKQYRPRSHSTNSANNDHKGRGPGK